MKALTLRRTRIAKEEKWPKHEHTYRKVISPPQNSGVTIRVIICTKPRIPISKDCWAEEKALRWAASAMIRGGRSSNSSIHAWEQQKKRSSILLEPFPCTMNPEMSIWRHRATKVPEMIHNTKLKKDRWHLRFLAKNLHLIRHKNMNAITELMHNWFPSVCGDRGEIWIKILNMIQK